MSAKYKLIIIREGYGAIHETEAEFVSVVIAETSQRTMEILNKAHEAELDLYAGQYEQERDWERSFE